MSSVRGLVDSVREEARGIGGAGARVRVDRFWVALAAVALAVFVCFFAVGHATQGAGSTVGEAPTTLQAESLGVPIPIALGGAAPIQENTALEAIAAANQRAREAPPPPPISIRASLRKTSTSGHAASSEVLGSTTSAQSTTSSAPEPTQVQPVQSTPAPSPAQSTPAPSAPATSPATHSGSSGGGGSFDSSE